MTPELQFELMSEPVFQRAAVATKRDYVALIEAAYDLAGDDRTWLLGLVRAASPILDRGLGVAGFFWDLSRRGKHRIVHPTYVGCSPTLHVAFSDAAARLTDAQARALYIRDRPCKMIGARSVGEYPRAYSAFRTRTDSEGFLLVSSASLNRNGCALAAPRAGNTPATLGLGKALDHVARHVAAGLRLRRAFAGERRHRAAESAHAILDDKGALVHVSTDAAGRRQEQSLVDAARRLVVARRVRHSSPEEAVELWRALILGRWSLVDHRDTDGKRFLLARPNPVGVDEPAALSERERGAAALFALLGSAKLVAYELGLAPSTISELLKSACRKLGCRNRAELASLLQPEIVDARPRD
jgi:DNA-binding CsgD family transcriptional regulator